MIRKTKTMSFEFKPKTNSNARSLFEPESMNDCPEGYTLSVWAYIPPPNARDYLNLRAKVDFGGLASFGQAVVPTIIDLSMVGCSLYVGGMSSVSIYYEKDPTRVSPEPDDDNSAIVSGFLIPGGSRTCEATYTDWPRKTDPVTGFSEYLPIPSYAKRITVFSVDNPGKNFVIEFFRGTAHTLIGNTGFGTDISKAPVQSVIPSYSDSFRVFCDSAGQSFSTVFSIVT